MFLFQNTNFYLTLSSNEPPTPFGMPLSMELTVKTLDSVGYHLSGCSYHWNDDEFVLTH